MKPPLINIYMAFVASMLLHFTFKSQNVFNCGTDLLLRNWAINNPEANQNYLKTLTKANVSDSLYSINGYSNKTASVAPVYTIPVVFHVLHQGGMDNISNAQIIDQINIWNTDYRKLNADTINVFAPFSPADARIEFRLATRDTNGNCTDGITRHYDSNTNWTMDLSSQYIYTWNPSKYLNVYVVRTISGGFTSGGYSSLPGFYPDFKDVIVIMNNSVGSIGTSNTNRSRYLTHEAGHWFNLLHPWAVGGTYGVTCGDDGVADTPITKGFSACPLTGSASAICNPPMSENFQNYMDYSHYCRYMFTSGQVTRMSTALNNATYGRNNVWTNANLIATGVINPSSPCALIADCYSDSYTVCTGQIITFNDISYNGTVTSRNWTASGAATVLTPTDISTGIIFPTVGNQTVALQVSNGVGASIKTRSVLVLNSQAQVTVNYQESFENIGLPANFSILNLDNDVTWVQTSLAAASGTNSYFIDGSSDAPSSKPDILETPSYDFSLDPTASFTFKYAYARKNGSNMDLFKVQASSDCGGTWLDIYQPTNSIMASGSGGTTNTPFFPAPAQFVTYTLTDHPNFGSFLSSPNVKIRFSFTEDANSGYGNNIFLDDINFNSANIAGVNALTKSIAFNLFPNPAEAIATIQITLSDKSDIKYFVTDVVGNIVEEEKSNIAGPGIHKFLINENQKLISGIYFINFSFNGQKVFRKLIIK